MPESDDTAAHEDEQPTFTRHRDGGWIAWAADDISVYVGRDDLVIVNGPIDSQLVIQVEDAPYLAAALAEVHALDRGIGFS